MTLKMSCAFLTSLDSHENVRIAEQLGFERAWLYDSPALCADVWTQLCRAADRTERIGLGPGVLVPALRHPMATASAITTLVGAAGSERVTIGVGSGFTGRMTLGQRPWPWRKVAEYIGVVQALLRGERVEWDDALIEMMHYPGFAPERPIEVPFVIAAQGPKGRAVAKDLGAGVLSVFLPDPEFDWSTTFVFGTVLDEGEDPGSTRAINAGGHFASVSLHFAVEHNMLEMVPGGEEWAATYADVPENIRHIALHDGHLWAVNDRDRPFVTGEVMTATGAALGPDGWREKIAQLEAGGATEVAYQPAGPDIPRELEAFAKIMQN